MFLNEYTFHIVHVCQLHVYCTLHIDPTLLHILVKKQQNTSLTYYGIAIYVPATNMPPICHMPKLLNMINEGSVLIYMPHMNSLAATIS